MRRAIGRALRTLANQLDPATPRKHDVRSGDVGWAPMDERREDAMSVLDEDVRGYLLVLVRGFGPGPHLEPHMSLTDEMWPAMCWTLALVVEEGRRVFSDG